MNGRILSENDVIKLLDRFKDCKKGIPASKLGIKSWGIIDYARNYLNLPILIDRS